MNPRKPKHIRKLNTKSIINIIREENIVTKSDIAKKINISQQAINNIVTELIRKKLVLEAGLRKSTKEGGKRPVLLKFNENAGYIIGAMMGLKKIKGVLANYNADIIVEKFFKNNIRAGHEEIISSMIEMFEEMIKDAGIEKNKVLGIGIGVPGIVDEKSGVIRLLPYMYNWENIKIAKIIKDRMGIGVYVSNENRVRSYGEKMFGLAKKVDNFAVILTGYGIGGGFFTNDECITGKNLFAGEFGHIKLSPDGPKCVCGNKGCLNALANTVRINNLVKEYMNLSEFKDSILARKYRDNNFKVESKTLFECFYDGDNLAKKIVDEISYWLGVAVSIIVAVIDPELIIISGEYTVGGDSFIDKIVEVAKANILPSIKKNIRIKYSQLGRKAGLVGSVGVVLDKLL
jgi:predicted NBD/HSP70 family sugar kinase